MIPFRKFKHIYYQYLFSSFLYWIFVPFILQCVLLILSEVFSNFEITIRILSCALLIYSGILMLPLPIVDYNNIIYVFKDDILFIIFIINLLIVIYFYKSILQDIIFGKYSAIKINTKIKNTNADCFTDCLVGFSFLKFFNITIYSIIMYYSRHIFKDYNSIIIYTLYIITDFFIINLFLEKYITIEKLPK